MFNYTAVSNLKRYGCSVYRKIELVISLANYYGSVLTKVKSRWYHASSPRIRLHNPAWRGRLGRGKHTQVRGTVANGMEEKLLSALPSVIISGAYLEEKGVILDYGMTNMNLSFVLHTSRVAHQVGAYPGFRSMKRLGVFLLPPGWDASPSQGYPQHWICLYPFIHLGEERHR